MRPNATWIASNAALIVLMAANVSRGQNMYPGRATELAKANQNPLSGLLSVPLQFHFMSGGDLADRTSYTLLVQPIFPLSVGSGWNVITRPIVPYSSVPGSVRRSGGFGDIELEMLVSPAQNTEIMWGIGPVFSFPTATDDGARTGAWGLGPSAVAVRQLGAFVIGGLIKHVWTFADYENDLPNISRFSLQPVVNYNFPDGWALNFAPVLSGNWTAPDGHQITIPLGLGFSKVTFLGRQPMSLGAEYYHHVVRPDGSGAAHLKLHVSLLFPPAS